MENSNKTSCNCSKHNTLKKPSVKGGKKMSALNIVTAVLLFLFPKCPMCWAAYAWIFSYLGLEKTNYNSNWGFIILGVFLIGSFILLRKHYINKSWFSFTLYSMGMFLLLTTYYLNLNQTWWLYIVLGLILLSNLSIRYSYKLAALFKKSFIATT